MTTWNAAFSAQLATDLVCNINGKKCTKCGLYSALENFDKNRQTRSGRANICMGCRQLRANERYFRNNDKYNRRRRAYGEHLRHTYGITPEDVATMLNLQKGCCGLCFKPFLSKWVVDHSHKRNKVRALLHYKCNIMLGYLETNPDLVPQVQAYLKKFEG